MIRRWSVLALAGILVGSLAPAAAAQESEEEQQELRKKLDGKLAEPWVANGSWITDYDAARSKAKETGKPIVAYFTRSYAF